MTKREREAALDYLDGLRNGVGESMRIIPRSRWKRADDPYGYTKAWLWCPECDERMLVDQDVSSDGKVFPSLACPFCEFHDFVQLAGWSG